MENNSAYNIDLVYLWVDGNDPIWKAKHDAFIDKNVERVETNCVGRYISNDELKYSLRSIELYAPWVRKIFLITDHQIPSWLDFNNSRICIIDHQDILPAESLPCFNSALIEKFFHKIPDLSEHFIYANDDTFLSKPSTPADFFTSEGFPIVRLKRKPFRKFQWFLREKIRQKPLKNYSASIKRASIMIQKLYGIYYTGMPHHNIDAYRKSFCQYVAEHVLKEEFQSNWSNHLRSDNDVQRIVYSYIALAEKKAKLKYVGDTESMIVRVHKEKDYDKLQKKKPLFFCMNDSEYVKDHQRIILRTILNKLFPNKSSFEL